MNKQIFQYMRGTCGPDDEAITLWRDCTEERFIEERDLGNTVRVLFEPEHADRKTFEEFMMRISHGCADIDVSFTGEYIDPTTNLYWNNWTKAP